MDDEKNVFLKSLENESEKESAEERREEPKGMSGTAIFASLFVFLVFLIVLLIFILSLSGAENPILQSFGVAGQDVKEFLTSVVNKTFMSLSILLLLLFSIGIFRGFSLPKEETPARRNSFIFGGVCGALIFLVILAWIGSFAFIDKFAVASGNIRAKIEVTNLNPDEEIIAPLDIHFSAEKISEELIAQKRYPKAFQWSKDEGQNFTTPGLDEEITFAFETKGRKEVVLKVIFENDEEEIFRLPFTVDEATFSLSPLSGEAPFSPTLDASALIKGKNPKSFEWDMDNNGSYEVQKTVPRLSYTFERPGKYPVSLRILFQDDSVQTFSRTITVDDSKGAPLGAVITAQPDTKGNAPFTVSLSAENSFSKEGKIISYEWSIGEKKEKKNGMIVNYTFTTEGKYPVSLTVTNDIGKTNTKSMEIEVSNTSHSPTAFLKTTPPFSTRDEIIGVTPLKINLDASLSKDEDNDIVKYEWFLGEEEVPFSTGDKTEYTFREKGTFPLRLQITDSEGNKGEKIITVTTTLPDIMAHITADPENGSAPLISSFDGSQSSCKKEGCNIISFEWDFGDGTAKQVTGSHTSHQFSEVGNYTVTLTITTNTGEKAIDTKQIAVTRPPFIACFEPSRSSGKAPLTVTFNPSECSQGNIKEYEWDFGDGVLSSQRKPSYTFEKPGTYTVTLTIFDENKSVSTAQKIITVEE